MVKFQKAAKVNASADKAWEVIGDLTIMGRFGGAADVKVQGMKRVCTFANGAVQQEEISNYSPQRRTYNYAIEGGPLPVKNNRGKFVVQPVGNNSKIVWDAEFDPLDPSQETAIAQMWEGAMQQVLQSIKQLIEER